MIKAKAILVITIAICFVAVLGGCNSEAKDKIDKNIEACESYYKAQNYQSAIESGKKAVKSSPKNNKSHFWLGNSYSRIGEYKLAIEELKKAEALAKNKRDLATIANNLGVVYSNLGNNDEALMQHNRALLMRRELADNNDIAISLQNLASIFSTGEQKEKAIEYYQEALKYQSDGPDAGSVYGNMGNVYIDLNKYDEAEQLFKKALDVSEQNGNYHNQAIQIIRLGNIQRLKQNYKVAENMLHDGLSRIQKVGDPDFEGDAYRKLGWLYRDLGKKAQAAENYNKALAIYTRLGVKEEVEGIQGDLDYIAKAN